MKHGIEAGFVYHSGYFCHVMINIRIQYFLVLSFIFSIRPFFTRYSRRIDDIRHDGLQTILKSNDDMK
jgi:hypothetical protein